MDLNSRADSNVSLLIALCCKSQAPLHPPVMSITVLVPQQMAGCPSPAELVFVLATRTDAYRARANRRMYQNPHLWHSVIPVNGNI
jgi:hypothetical protein